MGICLDKYQELFGQLQKQTDIMQCTSLLLDPYVSRLAPVAPDSQRAAGLGQE